MIFGPRRDDRNPPFQHGGPVPGPVSMPASVFRQYFEFVMVARLNPEYVLDGIEDIEDWANGERWDVDEA